MTPRVKCSRSPTLWIEPCIVYGGKLNWLLLLASVPRMWNSAKPAPGHFPSGSPWLRAGSLNASNNQFTANARTWDLFLYLHYSQCVFASFIIIIIITIMMIIMIRFLFGLNPSVCCWSGCVRLGKWHENRSWIRSSVDIDLSRAAHKTPQSRKRKLREMFRRHLNIGSAIINNYISWKLSTKITDIWFRNGLKTIEWRKKNNTKTIHPRRHYTYVLIEH